MSINLIGISPRSFMHFGKHVHDSCEIILTVEGNGIFEVNGVEYPFNEGSIHVISPNMSHVKSSEKGFKDIYIQTDDLGMQSLLKKKNGIMCLEDDTERSLTSLAKMMLYKFTSSNKNDSSLALMQELFIKLLAEKCASAHIDPVVESVSRYLALNFNEPELSIAKVLTDTGYNKDYIRRRFMAVYGVTPGRYLTDLRIENAKRLLRQRMGTGASIADVGAMCGYYDGHYFSKIFKKYVGVEPREYSTTKKEESNELP